MTEPTDAELDELRQANSGRLNFVTFSEFRTIARAVLAKWGAQDVPASQGDALDAARYRYLRDGDWREHEKLESVIRLQLNTLWDAKIDAARAAQDGGDVAMTTTAAPARAADSVLEDAALPMQPICVASDGVVRFKKNRMVNDMYEFSQPRGFGLNEMARGDYTQEERMQFAQLIGYSVSGYGSLSYASSESVEKADAIADLLIAARKQGANHD